jgi:hypothetical protein
VSIAKDVKAAKSWGELTGRVFRGPGWEPAAAPAVTAAPVARKSAA